MARLQGYSGLALHRSRHKHIIGHHHCEIRNDDSTQSSQHWGSIVAILEVRKFPDPILRQRAVKVTRFDAKLAKLAADMCETMEAERGVGLAANQVGVLQRLCVVKPEDWEEPLILVNPK